MFAKTKKILWPSVVLACLLFFLLASSALGAGLVPCDGPEECDFEQAVILIQNIITFLIKISIAISALVFAASGYMMLTAGGNEGQIKKAKEMLGKVLIGFLFILSAWLIVYTITNALLKPGTADDFMLLN
ncbi:MAG: hypothetical protein A3G52_00260 [Candidatus Taylorbacteria bacterium RIFCSPLOWO2_12_FULL_43_20]|uniref:TrbC/VIRB2 family protein n=1 Tax=Candidatus Taylorbacteria bacterium RIFCSPLOWO2_12_FULL_43_20 TaxID=1802332 RepID=A0A1G2P1F9_9BACT|nr:MAG: hypothetical protein A2825_01655 [Candidatus Taylorbacteria bacterium RIFCSPHIGHO2_01_FULL_43_120]OHA23101.1 MAG: hypothetical protein A3B98_03550 [Candidatus Taylorbacteria bacterium RIFCSPHIGHO2_02_FULL_43_55]OHA28918.1 MAG: hypothetical protein A3E92_04580 [Candidatus Taylorbacteria bacterium RIFCSPHIGHO2_12_FULL_42_34]OHA30902.1 MAG: hypothetical protein A3B09_04530 [Candidatus Taylorbacteria bacterium RIFCSPLOWO2_01_FULL_43_83]OHA39304.1 MAG: hypothetical protein A3H58_03930 [Candi